MREWWSGDVALRRLPCWLAPCLPMIVNSNLAPAWQMRRARFRSITHTAQSFAFLVARGARPDALVGNLGPYAALHAKAGTLVVRHLAPRGVNEWPAVACDYYSLVR